MRSVDTQRAAERRAAARTCAERRVVSAPRMRRSVTIAIGLQAVLSLQRFIQAPAKLGPVAHARSCLPSSAAGEIARQAADDDGPRFMRMPTCPAGAVDTLRRRSLSRRRSSVTRARSGRRVAVDGMSPPESPAPTKSRRRHQLRSCRRPSPTPIACPRRRGCSARRASFPRPPLHARTRVNPRPRLSGLRPVESLRCGPLPFAELSTGARGSRRIVICAIVSARARRLRRPRRDSLSVSVITSLD